MSDNERGDDYTSEDEQTELESNENEQDSKGQVVVTEEMKMNLKKYINLCEQIKGVKEDIKVLSDEKAEVEGIITLFMAKNNIPTFKLPNGRISVYNSKSVQPLNKEYLKETISSKIADPKIADEITELAFSQRKVTNSQKIRHVPERNKER